MTRRTGELGRLLTTTLVLAMSLLVLPGGSGRAAVQPADGLVEPHPGMVITQDTTFAPGEYDFSSGQGITIAADGITVDGNGAVLVGPGKAGTPSSFAGTAVSSEGHSNVTLKNLSAKGFDLGLKVSDGSGWTISDNDFSDNYTDPSFGWGDGPSYGAVMLVHVSKSTVARNKGDRVWNGLHLRYSDDNTITDNHFSPCSNVCLKMWRASRNLIKDNTMSYGIRVDPGETHARDSASVLIETGSNDNRFIDNDFTHGGDGVFIRPLNGFLSTGNYFEGNDASYAHNNAWECWSPGNTFIDNKANYSSYGFWLGGSDHTVLIGNEAAYNGTVNANAPEPFGNAGIAVVHGSSSHFIVEGNNIHDNKSVGLALGYLQGYEAYHWIIQQNRIEGNSTYGIYMYNSRWITLAGNVFSGNGQSDIQQAGDVTDVVRLDATLQDEPPKARATMSVQTVYPGEPVTFDASASTDPNGLSLSYRWDLGDGDVADTAKVTHRYLDPGFYRVGVTVNDGRLADLAWFDVYVVEKGDETGTEGTTPDQWAAELPGKAVAWTVSDSAPDHSGNPALYSGSGPNFDRGIVRQVSVPAGSPTLTFDTYYEIEQGYDFGFVQVSADGGKTFTSLGNANTTTQTESDAIQTVKDNVPGFSGDSSGWVSETFDLSDYAGKDVLLSFRYVTDPGVDKAGWWIDDVRVGGNLISDGSTLEGWKAREPDEGPPTAQISVDKDHRVKGAESIRIDSNGKTGIWRYPASENASWDLSDKDFVALWVSFQHEVQGGFDTPQPVVRLKTDASDYFEYTPRTNYLDPSSLSYSEARDGWQDLQIPLGGSQDWDRKAVGDPSLGSVRYLEVVTDSREGSYILWLDGITFGKNPPPPDIAPDLALNATATGYPRPSASYTFKADRHLPSYDNLWAPLDGSTTNGHIWSDWNSGHATDWYQVDFGEQRELNEVGVYFVSDANGLRPPKSFGVEYWDGGSWKPVENPVLSSETPVEGLNSVTFDTLFTSRIRVVVENRSSKRGVGVYTGISELRALNTGNYAGNSKGPEGEFGTPVASASSNDAAKWAPIDGSIQPSSAWVPSGTDGGDSWFAVDFVRRQLFNKVNLYLYDGEGTALPSNVTIQYWTGSAWADVDHQWSKEPRIVSGRNTFSFDTVRSRKVRVILHNPGRTVPELRELEVSNGNLLQVPKGSDLKVTPSASYTSPYDTVWGPLDGSYASSPRWTSWNSTNPKDWYAVEFSRPTTFSRVNLFFYNDNGGVKPPADYTIQYWDGSGWVDVKEVERSPKSPAEGFNTVIFQPVTTTKVRVLGTNQNPVNFGVYIGLTEFEVFRWD